MKHDCNVGCMGEWHYYGPPPKLYTIQNEPSDKKGYIVSRGASEAEQWDAKMLEIMEKAFTKSPRP